MKPGDIVDVGNVPIGGVVLSDYEDTLYMVVQNSNLEFDNKLNKPRIINLHTGTVYAAIGSKYDERVIYLGKSHEVFPRLLYDDLIADEE